MSIPSLRTAKSNRILGALPRWAPCRARSLSESVLIST
jgi:hypothetical protein